MSWSLEQLARVDQAPELEIATRRPDSSLRRWLPIWVVRANDEVFVRTWYRRDTGWYGHAVQDRAATVRVPGLEADVTIEYVGASDAGVRTRVDEAYRAKYGAGGRGDIGGMTTDEAAATTLRLTPAT